MASFEQNKNKTWSVRFRYVEFGQLINKRLSSFLTKKEANSAYVDFMKSHQDTNKVSQNSNMLMDELFELYIKHINNRLKNSSIYDINNTYHLHIKQYFGQMKIFKITKHDILEWQNMLNEKKYSYKYKSKLRGFLSTIFKHAMYYYDLPFNPVLQVEPFKRIEPKKEMQVWSLEEFNKFNETITNLEYKTFFNFLFFTGCRKGEAFALTWNDINFNTKIATINKNLSRKVFGKPYEITTTKTKTSRQILLPDNLIDLLAQHKKTFENLSNTDFVFGGKTPLAENTVSRVFNKHIKQAKVKPIHIHCLRHSHASILISTGASIVMVAKRLGHSSIEQTLNTYSHLMPNEEKEMLEKINKTTA